MNSAQCHGRLAAILTTPMTLYEAQVKINEGVSGSSPEFVSLNEVFNAGMSLLVDGWIEIVDKRPPGHYDISNSLHVSTGNKPLLTFQTTNEMCVLMHEHMPRADVVDLLVRQYGGTA